MEKNSALVIIITVVILVAFYLFTKASPNTSQETCSKYSYKDGYSGCMSLLNSNNKKDKKCKFKIENKINQATRKMEFTYLCVEK